MVSVESLREYGADPDEGILRCAGKEDLYLMLVSRVQEEEAFTQLGSCIDSGDLKTAFELAHKLKGALANLSLTPMLTPIVRITESLRVGEARDYSEDLKELEEAKKRFDSLFG